MDMQLNTKTALVTGSTAGIGLEIARGLALEGAHVIVTGRNQAKLDAAIADIKASGGEKVTGINVTGILADAATAEGAETLIKTAPQVDILVNNLGIYESKPFADISDADWQSYFDANVMSGVRLARAFFPAMLERNWGRVIFISSETGLNPAGDMIHYAMTKTAQLSISRGMAQLTKGTNVTVNSVLPGPTRSEGIVDFLRSVATDPKAPAAEIEAEFFARDRPASLIQRLAEASEVANMVTYLASPRSSATNGAALRVDGGMVTHIA
jgi:NAD(P)-dependent dehydrogenase (short-subunit alcohol dehydrogenase family)